MRLLDVTSPIASVFEDNLVVDKCLLKFPVLQFSRLLRSSPSGTQEKRKLAQNFADQSRKLFGNKYDYIESHSNFQHFYSSVAVICPHHGRFFVTPKAHLAGVGCSKCELKDERNKERRIQKVRQIAATMNQRLLPGVVQISPTNNGQSELD